MCNARYTALRLWLSLEYMYGWVYMNSCHFLRFVFVFGCAESLLLGGFPSSHSSGEQGLLHCAQPSRCSDFSCCKHGL